MDARRALYWSAIHTLVWVLGFAVGAALVVGGYFLDVDVAIDMVEAGEPLSEVATTAAPGLAVALLGVVVWRLVSGWVLFRTLVPAVQESLAETYDNERVKSEILAVLDERLADMQEDLQGVQRELRSGDDGFEFD